MPYLLDTVALVRWWTDPDRLGRRARAVFETSDAAIFVSPINVWEIANKNRIGKLPEVVSFETSYAGLIRENAFTILPLTDEHAMRAGYLPGEHRDPFDRDRKSVV